MKRATFFLTLLTVTLAVPAAVFATGSETAAAEAGQYLVGQWAVLAGGLCIAIAATAGTLAHAWAASNALQGIARNPDASGKIFTPMILALALIESLVIYALVIAFMIVGKA